MSNIQNNTSVESTCHDASGFNFIWSAFSLVPEMLLDDESPDLWLNFLRERIPRNQLILSVPIPEQKCVCLVESRPNAECNNHVIPFLIKEAIKHEPNCLTALRQGDRLAVAVMQSGRLQLANIYDASTKEQTLYWLLSIYEQLQLDITTPLYVSCGVSTRRLLASHLQTHDL